VQADGREYLRRVGPLLVGGAVACSAAAAALSNTLDEPAFEALLHLMVLVGIAASGVFGARGARSTWLGVIVIAVAAAAASLRLAPLAITELVFPPEVVADEDLTWATLMAWMMVGFCFMLARRQNILFAVVSGLAIFGLTATLNLNTAMLISFAVFVFAVVFIWGYEHLLNVGEHLPHDGRGGRDWPLVARTQALAGTMLVAVLLTVGIVVGSVLYAIVPRLYVGPAGMARYARWMQVSLLSYGGMLNSFYVGQGPMNLPATPAIAVKSDRPALWRGAVFDHYTGRGWSREAAATRDLWEDEDGWLVVPGAEDLVGETNRQVVRLLGMDTRAMYAAAQPVKVRMTEASRRRTRLSHTPAVDLYGAIVTSQQLMGRGAEYEVISIMPPTDPEVLRAAPRGYPRAIVERYIEQMQVQAEAELGPLVRRIVADAETPYDKAEAIRTFLGNTCVYTTRAPAVPRGDDAAVHFVTSGKRGACDLFATSLAVMCRLAGVPSRVATGFQTGKYEPREGAYVALQRDAHAWAEVYFPGIGWVPFDVVAAESESPFDLRALLRGLRGQVRVSAALAQIGRAIMAIAAVFALLCAVVGPGVLIRWLRVRARPRSARRRMGGVFEWFRRRAARLAGIRPERWRTPAEMLSALAAAGLVTGPAVRERLDEFAARFYDRRYGRREPSDREIRATKAAAGRLLDDLRRDLHEHGRGEDGSDT